MKKLFLLDAFALIYRAHFAFSKNPRINSKGFNTGCVLGFTNTLLDIIKNEGPSHIAVCFDTKEPTFRHEEYAEYKAHREAQPEDITLSLPIIRDLISAFNIPILEKPGFEADDVVGTVAWQASDKGFEVYMMTPDKDYCQLVRDNVFLYKPNYMGKGVEVYDVQKVLDKWKVERVDQVADILGLWGDASDNIPGIPGIGEKTAQKLIAQYGSVEGLVENADQLKGKQKEKVIEFGQQGILSKHLATIHTDVPVEWTEEEMEYTGFDKEKVSAIFQEMEFRTLSQRLLGEKPKPVAKKAPAGGQMDLFGNPVATPAPAKAKAEIEEPEPAINENIVLKTADNSLHHYHLIDTPELRKSLVGYLEKQDEFAFDTETSSLQANEAELVGMCFSYVKGEAYYVPCPKYQEEAQKIVEEFRGVLENPNISKIGQNLKYDLTVMRNYGVELGGQSFDTMLAHYLISPDGKHNMDYLAEHYLHYAPISIETLIGKKGKNQKSMADLEPEQIVDYAAEDADITLQLKQAFAPQIEKNGLKKLFNEVEMPLVEVLAEMETNGVKINEDALAEISKELETEANNLQTKIFELAGEEFNIASPKQMGEILFGKMQLDPKAKKTKTGQYSTSEETLSKLAKDHEIIDHILSWREAQKLRNTYVDALPKLVSQKDGRIHTSYNQAVAATGRLSSTNPNLQNIPIRTERGRSIRKAFVPEGEDYTLLSADYSQIELRIMAAFAKDEAMIDAFKNGRDIHATTAAKVWGVPLEEVTDDQRRKAKTVNFGIIYGISAFGLSQRINIPRKEAAEIIEAYFREFPAIKDYMDTAVHDAQDNGYVETILGRRRYLRDINSRNATVRGFAERNAINAPIQGSAADLIKIAMINIHQWMKTENLKSRMILQVHDELVFEAHKDELELLQEKVAQFMKEAIELEVPLEVGMGTGSNWLEAH